MGTGNLSEISATEHRMDMRPGSRPAGTLPYRLGAHRKQVVTHSMNGMLEIDVIERAKPD